jgi:hypothetical protein
VGNPGPPSEVAKKRWKSNGTARFPSFGTVIAFYDQQPEPKVPIWQADFLA